MEEIDFVLIWVDGNDKKWQEEKNKYDTNVIDNSNNICRYRDWEQLKYWFRGVEKFAPWVRKVHFITEGHLPKWLNKDCPKLNIIKHSDYIPSQYLPTFSSHTIELNFDKIKELSEKFVYFNDDMFLCDNVKKTDFFINGLPRDNAICNIITPDGTNDLIKHILVNNIDLINRNFDKKKVINQNFTKWFSVKNGKMNVKNLLLYIWPRFSMLQEFHIPNAYMKSTLNEVWKKEYKIINETCLNKFRKSTDVNQWIFRYWQLMKGEFVPRNYKFSAYFDITNDTVNEICDTIEKQKKKIICINDSDEKVDFNFAKNKINTSFEKILSQKSQFEK